MFNRHVLEPREGAGCFSKEFSALLPTAGIATVPSPENVLMLAERQTIGDLGLLQKRID